MKRGDPSERGGSKNKSHSQKKYLPFSKIKRTKKALKIINGAYYYKNELRKMFGIQRAEKPIKSFAERCKMAPGSDQNT